MYGAAAYCRRTGRVLFGPFEPARPLCALPDAAGDHTTFPGAVLPPVNCGSRCVGYQTAATPKAGKYDIVKRLGREWPSLPIWRSKITLGRAEFIPSSNSCAQSSNFFETFGARFGRDLWCKPRYSAGNGGVTRAYQDAFLAVILFGR